MMASELDALRTRLDILEAQHVVAVGLLHALLRDRPALRSDVDRIFEQTIAGLLGSETAFPDISVRAVEVMREQMFGKSGG
ncbi:hypothetical protein [Variovorax guangxiensis]|uniref:hypothetical protein n=1 Tax=Variovorax guangxiensis TaxID=1775474 RepID=UPI002855C16A|nr:hypothetical protein [Variovorax guangxiensis]MDR6857222.1 (p)ppGpp synthase/HD superfamily hydrolase [Variovorax guangxiensis]